jgi:hypothetical protein
MTTKLTTTDLGHCVGNVKRRVDIVLSEKHLTLTQTAELKKVSELLESIQEIIYKLPVTTIPADPYPGYGEVDGSCMPKVSEKNVTEKP